MILLFSLSGALIHVAIITIAVLAAASLLGGVYVKNWKSAAVVAVALSLLNATIGSFLELVTFGLITFIVDSIVILIASKFVNDFKVNNFWWALIMALIISIISTLIKKVLSLP